MVAASWLNLDEVPLTGEEVAGLRLNLVKAHLVGEEVAGLWCNLAEVRVKKGEASFDSEVALSRVREDWSNLKALRLSLKGPIAVWFLPLSFGLKTTESWYKSAKFELLFEPLLLALIGMFGSNLSKFGYQFINSLPNIWALLCQTEDDRSQFDEGISFLGFPVF